MVHYNGATDVLLPVSAKYPSALPLEDGRTRAKPELHQKRTPLLFTCSQESGGGAAAGADVADAGVAGADAASPGREADPCKRHTMVVLHSDDAWISYISAKNPKDSASSAVLPSVISTRGRGSVAQAATSMSWSALGKVLPLRRFTYTTSKGICMERRERNKSHRRSNMQGNIRSAYQTRERFCVSDSLDGDCVNIHIFIAPPGVNRCFPCLKYTRTQNYQQRLREQKKILKWVQTCRLILLISKKTARPALATSHFSSLRMLSGAAKKPIASWSVSIALRVSLIS